MLSDLEECIYARHFPDSVRRGVYDSVLHFVVNGGECVDTDMELVDGAHVTVVRKSNPLYIDKHHRCPRASSYRPSIHVPHLTFVDAAGPCPRSLYQELDRIDALVEHTRCYTTPRTCVYVCAGTPAVSPEDMHSPAPNAEAARARGAGHARPPARAGIPSAFIKSGEWLNGTPIPGVSRAT